MKLKLEQLDLARISPKFNKNFDARRVRSLLDKHNQEVKRRAALALSLRQREKDLLQRLDPQSAFAVDRKKTEALSKAMSREIGALAQQQVDRSALAMGHNPTFFPPFWDAGYSVIVGGAVSHPRASRQPSIGEVWESVAAYLPGGNLETRSAVGALTIAPSTEVITVRVNAFAAGVVAAFSVLGYGHGAGSLTASVSAEGSGGFGFSSSATVIKDVYEGVEHFPLTMFQATTTLRVNAGDLIFATCGVHVSAGCGGLICSAVSNVRLSGIFIEVFD